jgi:hypothetical protein
MGSTLAFRTGFAHGRRKNALAEGKSRSPAAKRVTIILEQMRRPRKREKGETKRSGSERQLGMVMD